MLLLGRYRKLDACASRAGWYVSAAAAAAASTASAEAEEEAEEEEEEEEERSRRSRMRDEIILDILIKKKQSNTKIRRRYSSHTINAIHLNAEHPFGIYIIHPFQIIVLRPDTPSTEFFQ